MKSVTIYTDGACRGNPGPGGWAALLIFGADRKEVSGGSPETTNNRMELTAAIEALKSLAEPCAVDIHTDSTYVQQGMLSWMANWKRRGWQTAGRKPVKNRDLWQALDSEAARHEVNWHWVRGHNFQPENERCDELANLAIDAL
jgi:ribonuclease HI